MLGSPEMSDPFSTQRERRSFIIHMPQAAYLQRSENNDPMMKLRSTAHPLIQISSSYCNTLKQVIYNARHKEQIWLKHKSTTTFYHYLRFGSK